MSIAEKLQTIAENEQRVYNAGYEKGKAESGDTEEIYNNGYTDGYAQGTIDGKQAEYDTFWDNYQQNGERYNWNNAFFGQGWTDKTYNPKYSFDTIKYCNSMFQTSNITDTLKPIDFSNFSSGSSIFQACSRLKTIQKLTVVSNVKYSNWFTGCSSLESITFSGEIGNDIDFSACTLLTYDSLMSIINALKDFSDTTETRTLTIGDTNKAKLTETEIAIATQKGWSVA